MSTRSPAHKLERAHSTVIPSSMMSTGGASAPSLAPPHLSPSKAPTHSSRRSACSSARMWLARSKNGTSARAVEPSSAMKAREQLDARRIGHAERPLRGGSGSGDARYARLDAPLLLTHALDQLAWHPRKLLLGPVGKQRYLRRQRAQVALKFAPLDAHVLFDQPEHKRLVCLEPSRRSRVQSASPRYSEQRLTRRDRPPHAKASPAAICISFLHCERVRHEASTGADPLSQPH
eukprot:scaffold196078_cov20-Tisochrysis_lutea.AAC.2